MSLVLPTAEQQNAITTMLDVGQQKRSQQKAKTNKRAELLCRQRASAGSFKRVQSPTPPPTQIELIRPGKRIVKVTANAVEITPSKRMRAASASAIESSPSAKKIRSQ